MRMSTLRSAIWNFYPRSPCGERLASMGISFRCRLFLSTLSLRRATAGARVLPLFHVDFYPRSPCGERPRALWRSQEPTLFLSTLSLRRATLCAVLGPRGYAYFYPRSPCGERRSSSWSATATSQHFYPRSPCGERRGHRWTKCHHPPFLSTLSLRRATISDAPSSAPYAISIHALLAESDGGNRQKIKRRHNFYPRSPCGERLGRAFWPGLSF